MLAYSANACVEPYENIYINSDTILCSGTYYLNDVDMNGVIIINASNIVLDCNGSTINGNRTGGSAGISNGYLNLASGSITDGNDNITVKNCIIEDYFIGLFWIRADNGLISNNTAYNNIRTGIELDYSNNNTLINNDVIYTHGSASFDGHTFGTFAGIEVRYSNYTELIGNNVENNEHGIFVGQNSEYAIIINNSASNNEHGIAVLLFNNALLMNNTASYNYNTGFAIIESNYIDLYGNEALNNIINFGVQANHSKLRENRVSGGYAGIGLISGTRNTSLVGEALKNISISVNLTHNPHPPEFCYNITLANNTVSAISIIPGYFPSGFGIGAEECKQIEFEENSVDDNSFGGIVLLDSLETNVNNNHISDNTGYGIYLEYSYNISIKSNEINENVNDGIKVYSSNHEDIRLNSIGLNKKGVYIINSSGWDIINNTLFNNTEGNIIIDPSDNFRVEENIITNSTDGINLIEVSNTNLSGNIIEFNNVGARIEDSSNFNIINNIFRNNTETNIIIDPSSNFNLIDNIISFSNYGLKIIESIGGFLLRNIFEGNNYAIFLDSSDISTNDSEISGSVYYDILMEDSNNTLTNTTFDSEKTNLTGPSLMPVKWFLDIHTIDSNENVIENANVVGYDNNNDLVFNLSTDSNGYITTQELKEYEQNSTDKILYSPYIIHIEKEGYFKEIEVLDLNENMDIKVILDSEATSSNINIDPDMLNINSKGKFIKVFIETPGYNVSNIDINTVMMNNTISAINDTKYGFVTSPTIEDRDEDGLLEFMAVFYREEVETILFVGENILGIAGKVDGVDFEGSDTIIVIG